MTEFEALLDAAVDAIVVIDHRGLVVAFNPAAEQLFGYRADEVAGRNVSMLMPQPYRREHDRYLENYQRTGEPKIIGIGREVTAQRKDGSTFPIYLTVGESRREGRPSRFVGIIRDISDLKRYQEELRQREEQLRLVFDNAPLATATFGEDGGILGANQAFCSLFGYPEDEVPGLSFRAITHPDHLDGAARRLAAAFRGEIERYALTERYLTKDGREIVGMLHAGVAHDSDGRPQLLVAQIEDRTGHFRAEEELRQHRERLAHVGRISVMGEMAAGLAHEINQPLSAISNYAQASRRLVAQGETGELDDALDKISAQALRAGEVIRRLRSMIRKSEAELERVDVNDLVHGVLGLVEADARASGVRLRLELTPDLPPVRCDVVQIQQVLLNLVRNAIDTIVGDAGRHLKVVIETGFHGPHAVRVAVADSGPGVDDETAQRLFTPFFTTKPKGLGLGLSISRTIVESHGGELAFTANQPQGAVFWFTLPRATEPEDDE